VRHRRGYSRVSHHEIGADAGKNMDRVRGQEGGECEGWKKDFGRVIWAIVRAFKEME